MNSPSSRRSSRAPAASPRGSAGFTLVELLIAVAIVGILASVAYPSYQRHVQQARVSDGQAKLMEIASRLERCFTENRSYTGCDSVSLPVDSEGGFYEVTDSISPTTYTLTATHSGNQVKAECKTMTLNQAGRTTPSTGCW